MKKVLAVVIFGFFGVGILSLLSFTDRPEKEQDKQYTIVKKWELPDELNEISAIEWFGENRVVAVHDERGVIIIYNLATGEIEDQVKFGEEGDYEGVAVINNDAYVLRSDGTIIGVRNFQSDPKIETIVTPLSGMEEVDAESLLSRNGELLLAVKEWENDREYKGIYKVDPNDPTSSSEPVHKIMLNDPIFEGVSQEAKYIFRPGAFEIHPETGEFYVLDGSDPKLLITDPQVNPQQLIPLDIKDFRNPEGITFDTRGNLYISNEAGENGAPANILQVVLK